MQTGPTGRRCRTEAPATSHLLFFTPSLDNTPRGRKERIKANGKKRRGTFTWLRDGYNTVKCCSSAPAHRSLLPSSRMAKSFIITRRLFLICANGVAATSFSPVRGIFFSGPSQRTDEGKQIHPIPSSHSPI